MRYIRANIQGGIEIGFDAVTASLIAAQTVKGARQVMLSCMAMAVLGMALTNGIFLTMAFCNLNSYFCLY